MRQSRSARGELLRKESGLRIRSHNGRDPGSIGRLTLVLPLALLLALCVLSGCATDGNSVIPWNVPQPWEGGPMIPGLQQQ